MFAVESATPKFRRKRIEDFEVAASVREAFRLSIQAILRDLHARGVRQATIAERMGWAPSMISKMKNGTYYPGPEVMDELLRVLNDYTTVEAVDFFRVPGATREADLLRDLARLAGYEIVKKTK